MLGIATVLDAAQGLDRVQVILGHAGLYDRKLRARTGADPLAGPPSADRRGSHV